MSKQVDGLLGELLKTAIDNRKCLTRSMSVDEWDTIYYICELQEVIGFVFTGILKLPEEQMPPSELFAKWQKEAQKENEKRDKVAEICWKACETHGKNGFNSCVLMPCGVYSDPKDVDILCWSKDKKDGKRTIVEYVNFQYVASTHHIKPKVVRHHVNLESGNVPLEVRFKSDYLNCPWYNKRFEAWVREMVEKPSTSNNNKLPYEFYVVYLMLHLYRKLFCEGIRLGHMLEYYMVLREFNGERSEVMHIIERLGMKKFAGAVMYVLQAVFAMPDECLICKSDARHGSFVLNMTMMAGEYTRYIERTRTLSHLGRIGHHLYWLKRNRPFITQYPAEMFFDLYKRMKG